MEIEIDNLSFDYGEEHILEQVNFSVKRGSFVAIFGPNGGGKTTLLKLLAGLLKPSEGSISLFGCSPGAFRKQVGYVPQSSHFDKRFPLTVLEVVLMGCLSELSPFGFFHASTQRKAKEALRRVNLLGVQAQSFGTLSGGQAKRVLIARALVGNPTVLLLDEPTANVDAKAEEEILQLLSELSSTTIFMVTHELRTVLKKADTLLFVHKHLTSLPKEGLCEHVAMGLYHT